MKIQYQDQYITVFESALYRTTCTLIERAEHYLLVDPNWLPIEVAFIAEKVSLIDANKQAYLLFTHSDYDHIIAYERFMTDAKVIASQAFVDHPNPEKELKTIREFDEEYYIQRSYPISYPKVDIAIAGTEKRQLGNDTYHFLPADGHNRDGILTFHEELGVLILGDYLSNLEFPFIYESVAAYQATLDRITTLLNTGQVQLLITGHGDCTKSPSEMQKRLEQSQNYLGHLRKAVLEDTNFPEEDLWKQYAPSTFLKKAHQENLNLARKELLGRG
ncbi:MAG: MBL fold metallo-hydrolase [Bacteroidota bacterium]